MKRRSCLALGASAVLIGTFGTAQVASAENPIVRHIYTADPAALVVDDRLYLYTGHDEAAPNETNFVMRDWRVFSAEAVSDPPVPADWTDHGAALSLDDFAWADANAWAAEVEERDGRYYWYVSVDGSTDQGWMNIGVAVSDSPSGPFTDAIGGPLISDDTPNSSALNIDPTVYTDDGQSYLYWGSYWEPRMAKLKDNMIELDGAVTTPEGLDHFWEAPWLFERNGTYYMAYASNAGPDCVDDSAYACVRYATADSPAGPWTHRGVILDQVSSTTNHPAIVEFDGQWHMVYHTADAEGGGDFRRSVAIDELHFEPDGTIRKVVQTPAEEAALTAQSLSPTSSR